ncbi:MAG: ATP-binding cassette domain-containing protein [Clostridiales bacterium]
MEIIKVEHLTKDYGNNRGVFDISFSLTKGEAVAFLGPNGAGKTTTIRNLMGFIQPKNGAASVMSMNSWLQANDIQNYLGYIPGEISLPYDITVEKYFKTLGHLRKMESLTKAHELMEMFELNPKGKIKRMSKGMKQKISIVAAFMHDPKVLILDEPMSGLDPLMQNRFAELINQEKAREKTILMSSHIFENIEKTCDRIIMIKEGKIIETPNNGLLVNAKEKMFKVCFKDIESKNKFTAAYGRVVEVHGNTANSFKEIDAEDSDNLAVAADCKDYHDITASNGEISVKVPVPHGKTNDFISALNGCDVQTFTEVENSLSEYFMKYYGGESDE